MNVKGSSVDMDFRKISSVIDDNCKETSCFQGESSMILRHFNSEVHEYKTFFQIE